MEQISLPIIRLVEKRHIDTDTIISPVGPPPVNQQPETPVGTTFGASPFSQAHSSNHMSPGSEFDQYPDPSPNMQGLGIGYNSSHFQPNYGVATEMGGQQQSFGMAGATAPTPLQGHSFNASSPMQHAHSRSYGEISPLAQHLDQFNMGNQLQYGNDASRSMSRSYGSPMADPSSPFEYPVTTAPFVGMVGATTSMAMTTAGQPANFGMPTVGGQRQYSMTMAGNNNQMIDPALGTMGANYSGIAQQANLVQGNFGQNQYADMAMHRSHSNSNMMPAAHHNQPRYQARMQPGHQYRLSVGEYPPQPQQQLQNLHPGQQATRPRSTSGGNQRLGDAFMQQQHMRPN